MRHGSARGRPHSLCMRAHQKLKFLPNRPQTAPPKPRYTESRLLSALKAGYSEWEMRGDCPGSIVEKLLKLLDRKQNRIKYEIVARTDKPIVVRARACANVEWGQSIIVPGYGDTTYRQNITVVLCPLTIKDPLQQVIKTHVKGQYLVHDADRIIDSTSHLKQFTSLIKLTLPDLLVFRSNSYVEITGLNGHSLHVYPVVSTAATGQSPIFIPENHYLMAGSRRSCTWEPYSRGYELESTVSPTFHATVILLAQLRMLHRLQLKLEDLVAIATAAVSDHVTETNYSGPIPLQHCYSLSLRLLLHTLQSTRLIRDPVTNDIRLRKLVFGRSYKRDGYYKDIIKVCLMYAEMERCEEFLGLYPPSPLNRFETPDPVESEDEASSSDPVSSDPISSDSLSDVEEEANFDD